MIKTVFLNPGAFYFGSQPVRVETLLGSCVAFTIRDPNTGYAAMNHALLPHPPRFESLDSPYRFVATGLEAMFERFRQKEIPLDRLEMRMFGGAHVLCGLLESNGIGRRNYEAARKIVESVDLSFRSQDVGGTHARKVVFDTVSGIVEVKLIPKQGIPNFRDRAA